MADSYHIIDGKVVPYCGGRKCNDTDAWRDATQLELQLQEQLEEYEHTIATLQDDVERLVWAIEELQAEVERLRANRDGWEQHASDRAADWHAEYLRAERLAEALRRYGVHDETCTAMDIPICTCGLDAALEQEDV